MRTTLDIDDDVLAAAKELASAQGKTTGTVISDLARRALATPAVSAPPEYRNKIRLMPPSVDIVTPEMIDRLREDEF